MNKEILCPVCSKNRPELFFSALSSNIYLCRNCSLRFVYPTPSKNELVKFYRSGYFEGKKSGAGGYKDYLSLESNLKQEAKKKIEFIKKIITKGKLLDVGAGTGVFAETAKENSFNVSANDISPYAEKILIRKKIKTYFGPVKLQILPKSNFDVVTAWDVIEHMANVEEMLMAIRFTLKKGGYFFLTTPNTDSWDAKITGKKWYGYKKLPEHLIFLNQKSVLILFKKYGFKMVDVYPWGFYRSLGFVADRLKSYGWAFSVFEKIFNVLGINYLSLFFPMTDFMVVGKKVK